MDAVVDHTRHPPRALRLDAIANQLLILIHRFREQPDRLVEQLLVTVARGDQREHSSEQRRHLGAPDALHEHAVDQPLHVVVREHASAARQRLRRVLRERATVLRRCEPVGEMLRDVERREPSGEHIAAQKVARDEAAETAADLILACRDDRRVRDRDPERMAEERRHREPVRHAADH